MNFADLERGSIEVITGCMFSGKTEELLRRLERAEIAGLETRVFKPSIDDRYGKDSIGSHNGRKKEAEVVDPENPEKIEETLEDEEVVVFDEANFFSSKLVEVCESLADQGFQVVLAGLDTDFRGEPFSPVHELMARAEQVSKLKAICVKCGKPATKTQRIIDEEPAHYEDSTILVGADESYEARCRSCHEVKK